ncbi:bZIP transcription factor domain protein [Fusarium beomiforme]|uniref:BZIP transcription factor domain protein n=1 Tax=Fusarium beomiforme TaxID=44412 RepID=A0A9P5AEZ5_9HYPO|nr:bZIP transcription factor domain protein [Fusarium beomiforme]
MASLIVLWIGEFALTLLPEGDNLIKSASTEAVVASFSTNLSAIRIRDNQRRSRARHKEYVESLEKKLKDFERRGVEATLEMQQAARSVAIENSRLRMLLSYRGVTNEEIVKPFFGPVKTEHEVLVSQNSQKNSTTKVVDAAVGIKREPKKSGPSSCGEPQEYHSARRLPGFLLRPQPILPTISAPGPGPVDKLSVLANATVQQDFCGWKTKHTLPPADCFNVSSPSTLGPNQVTSVATSTTPPNHRF